MSDYNPSIQQTVNISFRLNQPLYAALRAEAESKSQGFGDYYIYLISEEYEQHYESYFDYIKNPDFKIKTGILRLEDLPDFGLDERIYNDVIIAPFGKSPIHIKKVPKAYIEVAKIIRSGLGAVNKSDPWIFRFLSQKIAIRKLLT